MDRETKQTRAIHAEMERVFGEENIPNLTSAYNLTSFLMPKIVDAIRDAVKELEPHLDEGFLIGFCIGIARANIIAGKGGGIDGLEAAAIAAEVVERVSVEHGSASMAELIQRCSEGDQEALLALRDGKSLKSNAS